MCEFSTSLAVSEVFVCIDDVCSEARSTLMVIIVACHRHGGGHLVPETIGPKIGLTFHKNLSFWFLNFLMLLTLFFIVIIYF